MDSKKRLQLLFNKIDKMDVQAFLSFLTNDVRFRFGNGPEVVNKEKVKTVISSFFKSIKGLRHSILEVWELSNTIICEGEVTYTRLNNSKVTIPFVNIFKMEKEHISDYLIYIDITPLYTLEF